MDTALPQKFPFILDRNLAKANCTGNQVCTSCDIVLLGNWGSHFTILVVKYRVLDCIECINDKMYRLFEVINNRTFDLL